MAALSEIIAFLDDLLAPADFDDYCPNGLQVPGSESVELVATGVSANRTAIERAIADHDAGFVLCHHGLFWNGRPRSIDATLRGRLAPLFAADVALAAYHLPLDAHPALGNNALLCDLLGFDRGERFAEHGGRPIGFVGRSEAGVSRADLIDRIRAGLGRDPLVQGAGPDPIHSLGIVSGGAAGDLRAAIELGLDGFLTGEPTEWAMAEAEEAGVHFIAAGHYATETLGVLALGEALAARFGIAHVFVDVPNPV